MQDNPSEKWFKDKTINVVREELGYQPLPCDHHWIDQHKPGHTLFWVKICSLCHEPDWDDLDREIEKIVQEHIKLTQLEIRVADRDAANFHEQLEHKKNRIAELQREKENMFAGPGGVGMDTIRKFMPASTAMQDKARQIVVDYFNRKAEKTDNFALDFTDTYVVWFSKTLQNWKVMVSTEVPDGMYYEVTYDGDRKTTYLDAYRKFENLEIPDKKVTHSIADP